MYTIYEYENLMYQYGERYMTEQQGEGGFVGEYEALDEAQRALVSYQFSDVPRILPRKRGLDSVEYNSVVLYDDELDEKGNVVGLIGLDGRDNLPEGWLHAINVHEDAYWKFLDYKASSYPALTDLIND